MKSYQQTIYDNALARDERLIGFLEYAKQVIIDDFEAARIENPVIKAPDCSVIENKIKELGERNIYKDKSPSKTVRKKSFDRIYDRIYKKKRRKDMLTKQAEM